MSRTPFLPVDLAEPAGLVAAIRARRDGRLNEADRMVLHAPAFARGWNELATAVRTELSLSDRLRALVICAVGVLNGADYQVAQHGPLFLKAGGAKAQLEALIRPEAAAEDTALFDVQERAALRLAVEMTRQVAVSDAAFAAAKAATADTRQLVELVGLISFYNMVSRFLVALEVDFE